MRVLKNFFQVCQLWPVLVIFLLKLVYLSLYILVLWPFTFQKMKREVKNLFSNSRNLNFWNSPIFALFHIFCASVRIISDAITTEVTILKFFLCHFICNMTYYHCAKFQVQSSTLPEFKKGEHSVVPPLPPPPGNTRPKKPGAARVKCLSICHYELWLLFRHIVNVLQTCYFE